MTDIFISYARADTQFVKELYNELQRFNVRGFMDEMDIATGVDFSRRIRDSIKHADALIVVLSESGSQSRWVMAEIGLAQAFDKKIIPVLAPKASYDRSVPEDLVDSIVISADEQPIELTAAKIVSVVTGAPVLDALSEVQTRARRNNRIIFTKVIVYTISAIAVMIVINQWVYRRSGKIDINFYAGQERQIQELISRSASLALSPNGKLVATGTHDGRVILWEIRTGRAVSTFRKDEEPVSALAFSPDGGRVATASLSGVLKVWEVKSGNLLASMNERAYYIIGLAFSSDGSKLISRSVDGILIIWDASTLKERNVIKMTEGASEW